MDTDFLPGLALAVLDCARVPAGHSAGTSPSNTTGGTLLLPSGRCAYPAFWVRDHALSVASGLISLDDQRHALLLCAGTQQADDWTTPSGSFVPRGAIADHITFAGEPIFFPGTLDPVQQSSAWGTCPSLDDHFLIIDMAWEYCRQSGRRDLLDEVVHGMSLRQRLELAFSVPRVREATQLVWCDEHWRGSAFGFHDAVIHTGDLLFTSLLRYRAAEQLAELTGDSRYATIAATIARSLPTVFAHHGGLLRASTGLSCQPDVFASAYAVYVGAVDGQVRTRICRTLAFAYQAGILAWRGGIRHLLTTDDSSAHSAWERTVGPVPLNTYQNGAYWYPPVGWVCHAIAQVDEPLARRLAGDYLTALRAEDYRSASAAGGPWECVHPSGDHRQTALCITAVTMPLIAFRRLGWLPG